MATAKSIIEIEVLDQQFKNFEASFHAYQNAVKNDAALWGRSGQAVAKLPHGIRDATSALGRFNDTARQSNSQLDSMLSNFVKIGKAGGLLALVTETVKTAIEAMNDASQRAGDLRKSSMGKGLAIGQMQALDMFYSKSLESGSSTAAKILASKNSFANRALFSQMGVDINANGEEQVSQATLAIKDIMDKYGPLNGIAMAKEVHGAGQWFTDEELNRIQGMSRQELAQQATDAKARKESLNMPDKAGREGQELQQANTWRGKSLEMVKDLTLASEFEKATKSVYAFGEATNEVTTALVGAAKKYNILEEPIQGAVKAGEDFVKRSNKTIADAAGIKLPEGNLFEETNKTIVDAWHKFFGGGSFHKGATENLENIKKFYELEKNKRGEASARDMVENIYRESKGDVLASDRDPNDPNAALGAFQMHKVRRVAWSAANGGAPYPTTVEGQFAAREDEIQNNAYEKAAYARGGQLAAERPADMEGAKRANQAAGRYLQRQGVFGNGKITVELKPQPGMDVSSTTTAAASAR